MRRIDIDYNELRYLIEDCDLQQHEVAKRLGVAECTIYRRCKQWNIQTATTGPRRGERHTSWKGGRRLVKGYWYVYSPDHPMATKAGYVAEHRLVMSNHLQRLLEKSEVVHHKDGNTQNNDLSNLELFADNSAHLSKTLIGQTPQWTPEGKERIQKGLTKRANQLRQGIGVPLRNQRTGRFEARRDKPSRQAS